MAGTDPSANREDDANRLLLAGFMGFDNLLNYLNNECNMRFLEGAGKIFDAWSLKNKNALALPNVDPYNVPDDVVKDITEPELAKHLEGLKAKIKSYPPYNQIPFDIKYVRIDSLLSLQLEINFPRASEIAMKSKIKKGMNTKELLDACVDTEVYQPDI